MLLTQQLLTVPMLMPMHSYALAYAFPFAATSRATGGWLSGGVSMCYRHISLSPQATCCPEDSEPYLAPPANYTPKGQVHVVTPAAGAPMRLYVVGPEGAAPPKAGVIVAHDIFGGDSGRHKQLCDTFAAAGYLVVMPDLFREAYDPDEKDLPMWKLPLYLPKAFPLVLARGWDNGVREDVQAAAAFLAARGVDRVGVIGFCYGAWVVMKACAGDVPQAACGVSVHPSVHNVAKFTPGGSETEAEAVVKGVRCPQLVLSSCSEPADWREGGAVQRWLQELPGPAGQCSELRDLPDTVRHGFCTRGDVRRPEVAAAVQEVVDGALQYFKTHLPL